MALRDVIAEAARERGNPVPTGVLIKAIRYPGIALRSLAGSFSYRGPPQRLIRLTASQLRGAGPFLADRNPSGDLAASIVGYQRSFCYHTAYLYGLCRTLRPEVVVETGVYRGASSAFALQALHDNGLGHLYSIDLPEAFANRSRRPGAGGRKSRAPTEPGSIVPPELRGRWTLLIGDARTELPKLLDRLGAIDLFHHDSEHSFAQMTSEFESAFQALRPGGLLVADDVLWNSAFLQFCKRKGVEPTVVAGVGFAHKPPSPKT